MYTLIIVTLIAATGIDSIEAYYPKIQYEHGWGTLEACERAKERSAAMLRRIKAPDSHSKLQYLNHFDAQCVPTDAIANKTTIASTARIAK